MTRPVTHRFLSAVAKVDTSEPRWQPFSKHVEVISVTDYYCMFTPVPLAARERLCVHKNMPLDAFAASLLKRPMQSDPKHINFTNICTTV